MINKIYGLIGLASRAGKVITGNDAVLDKLNHGKVKLIIVAEDASEKTKKNIEYYASRYNVEVFTIGTIEGLSKASGKENRAIIGILDINFASGIKKLVKEEK